MTTYEGYIYHIKRSMGWARLAADTVFESTILCETDTEKQNARAVAQYAQQEANDLEDALKRLDEFPTQANETELHRECKAIIRALRKIAAEALALADKN